MRTFPMVAASLFLAGSAFAQSFEQQAARIDGMAAFAGQQARLVLSAAKTPKAAPKPAAWTPVVSKDDSFTAELPAAAAYSETEVKGPNGESVMVRQYELNVDNQDFAIQTMLLPPSVDMDIQKGLDNAATELDGGKFTTVTWTTLQGCRAADAAGAMKDGQAVRMFVVVKDKRVFTLTYVGPAGTSASANAERFIKSLTLK